MRRVRRNVNRIGRDLRWIHTRLQREPDPAVVAELRALMTQMMAVGAIKPSGQNFQESKLPKPNGPTDCWLCHAVGGTFVPKHMEREFEHFLSIGYPPEQAWEQIADRDKVAGKGRGFVSLTRLRHEDHLGIYREWSERTNRTTGS
jgi:hypothetical protein